VGLVIGALKPEAGTGVGIPSVVGLAGVTQDRGLKNSLGNVGSTSVFRCRRLPSERFLGFLLKPLAMSGPGLKEYPANPATRGRLCC